MTRNEVRRRRTRLRLERNKGRHRAWFVELLERTVRAAERAMNNRRRST